MPRLPDLLRIVVTTSGQPVSGVMVWVGISVTRRNSIRFLLGPTSQEGVIQITRDGLLHEATRSTDLGLMDYGDPEADCAGTLQICPADPQEISAAVEAFDRFGTILGRPRGDRDALTRASEVLAKLGSVRLDATVSSVGGEVKAHGGLTRT